MLMRSLSVFRLLRHLRGIDHSAHSMLTVAQPLFSTLVFCRPQYGSSQAKILMYISPCK